MPTQFADIAIVITIGGIRKMFSATVPLPYAPIADSCNARFGAIVTIDVSYLQLQISL